MPLVALRTQIVRKRPRPAGQVGHQPRLRSTGGFQPFVAPDRPPPGSYDPAIDAQERATQRGFGDVTQDTSRDRMRLATNTTLRKQAVDRGAGRSLADVLRSRTRGGEDFATATADRQRGYQQLGVAQGAQAQSQGVTRGGTLAAALAARAENQGREQGVAQRSFDRFNEDSQTSQARIEENRQLGHGDADLDFTRGNEDLDTGFTRAGRENTQFGVDASEQRFFQAGQVGYSAPQKPSNESTWAGVGPVQTRKYGKNVATYDARGNLVGINGRRVVNGRVV